MLCPLYTIYADNVNAWMLYHLWISQTVAPKDHAKLAEPIKELDIILTQVSYSSALEIYILHMHAFGMQCLARTIFTELVWSFKCLFADKTFCYFYLCSLQLLCLWISCQVLRTQQIFPCRSRSFLLSDSNRERLRGVFFLSVNGWKIPASIN